MEKYSIHKVELKSKFSSKNQQTVLRLKVAIIRCIRNCTSIQLKGPPAVCVNAWMGIFGCANAWKSKKNCVNAWIEKTCVNVKNDFSIAWMRESALFIAWKREFSLFTQICANFPDFWIFPRLFPKISPVSQKIEFAWISRKTCVNAWIAKIFCVNARLVN